MRIAIRGGVLATTVSATFLLVHAFASRGMPELMSWHRDAPEGEFRAEDRGVVEDLADYLALEERVFGDLERFRLDATRLGGLSPYLRYVRGGPQDPARQPRNWNRTVELAPDGPPTGGALLLHGLSDSPYSLRRLAEILHARGYHVLVLRLPGHGTVPAGLVDVKWEDWAAAVRIGVRHVDAIRRTGNPLVVAGYSNGGALAVQYTLDAVGGDLPVPDQLLLFSPAIGITSFARVARWDQMYSFIPYFEKSKWLGIELEYDPYKYNSFPKNGGTQSWRLAREIDRRLAAGAKAGAFPQFPPVLTFQSVVDDTVLVQPILTRLYDRLPENGSEVVFFDVNRSGDLDEFIALDASNWLEGQLGREDLRYTITRVTNCDPESRELCARTHTPGRTGIEVEPLPFVWPPDVFSLSHLAVPIPPDDPVYGSAPSDPERYGIPLGRLSPRGERRVLRVPAGLLLRLRSNPFFPYVEERIAAALDPLSPR